MPSPSSTQRDAIASRCRVESAPHHTIASMGANVSPGVRPLRVWHQLSRLWIVSSHVGAPLLYRRKVDAGL